MRVSYGRRPGRRYTFVIYRPRGVCPVDVQAHHGRALRPWSSAQKELEIRTEGRIPWAGGEVVCVTLMAPRRPTGSAGAARTGRGSRGGRHHAPVVLHPSARSEERRVGKARGLGRSRGYIK